MAKQIVYQFLGIKGQYDPVTKAVVKKQFLATAIVPWSEEKEEEVKRVAYNGAYTIQEV